MKNICNILLATFLFASCSDDVTSLQNISGKAGEVVAVIDHRIWHETFRDTLHKILAPDYPMLPQHEPLFDLIDVQETSFSNMFQMHRNIVVLQLVADSVPEYITTKHDVWARPQTVIIAQAHSGDALISLLAENQERIIHVLEQAERDRVINATKKYEEKALRDTVNSLFGGSPYFPKGYVLRKKTPDFVWIGYEPKKTILGLFIYRYPYKDSTSLQLKNSIAERNKILQQEVPGQFENTYMTTVSLFPPQTRTIRYKDFYFVETRGFWDIENDFMGGPFISHSFTDPTGEYVVVVEAFVYNPRADKRNHLRQLEAVLYSFEWKTKLAMAMLQLDID